MSHVIESSITTVPGPKSVAMSLKEVALLLLLFGVGVVGVLAYTDVYPPSGPIFEPSDEPPGEITTESFFDDEAADGSVTSAPETTAGPPPGFPPGVTRERVENPVVLTRAHQRTLLDAGSWTQYTTTTVFVNATASVTATETAMVAEGGDLARGSFVVTGENPTEFVLYGPDTEYWVNQTAAYVRFIESNRTSAIERDDRYPVPFDVESTEWRTLYRLLGQTNTSFEGTVERRGKTLYRVVATTARYDESPYGNVRDFTLSALVSSDGVIREYVATFVRPAWGQNTRVVVHVEYSSVGTTTVDRPDWVPTDSANVTPVPDTASGATVASFGRGSWADGSATVPPWQTTGRSELLVAESTEIGR